MADDPHGRRHFMFTLNDIFVAFLILGLLLLVGKAIRRRSELLKSLFIPSSIVAGVVGLLLGPEVIGALARFLLHPDHPLSQGVFPEAVLNVWSGIPAIFISIVFATLFLGQPLPSLREIWRLAKPQVMFGQTLAWGQYVVGITLTMLVLTPLFGLSPLAGALVEISFEGGHGTAAGLAGTFEELGFAEGADLALGLATVGVVMGIVIGTVLVNWGARTGRLGVGRPKAGTDAIQMAIEPTPVTDDDIVSPVAEGADKPRRDGSRAEAANPANTSGTSGDETSSIEPLSLHLGYVGLAIGIGWLLLQGLVYVESMTTVRLGAPALMPYVPLFPMAMIGSIIVQLVFGKLGMTHLLDRDLINRISGTALDVTIVAALATLSLSVLGHNWAPFLLLSLAGIGWNLFAFLVLAPRMFPEYWFERGIADFGQSMGITVTGLLLLRLSDPDNRSGTLETFGYKQLLFEPIVGGGLFTAAALPLIAQFGPLTVLILTGVITAFWLVLGLRAQKSGAA